MIGYLFMGVAVIMFMMLGYVVLMGDFMVMITLMTVYSFAGLAMLILFPALWEFWFPKPAKMLIVHKRAAAYELTVDDIGWGELTPSKKYMPEGLVKWKFGWSLLPRPIRKLFEPKLSTAKKPPGRPPNDPEKAAKRLKEWQAKQGQDKFILEKERDMAEKIALKKIILKGTGKPLWLQYEGLAANFNPYVLVPLEKEQDNPHVQFQLLQSWIDGLRNLPDQVKDKLAEKLQELETHVDKIRVVIDPRRFQEVHPYMYTQSQVDAHGQIHEEIGRLGAGFPIGKILLILLIVIGVIGGIFVVYYFLMQQPPMMLTAILSLLHL